MTDPLDRPAIRLLAIEALHRSIGLLNEPAYARLRLEPDRDVAFADLELDSLSTLEALMEIEEAVAVELDPELRCPVSSRSTASSTTSWPAGPRPAGRMLDRALEHLATVEPRQRGRLFNQIEDILTPREYAALGERLSDPELAAFYRWRSVALAMAGQEPQSFERRQITPNVLLFSDPAHAARDKTLLVGFAGRLGRLMIPNVGFVQCLPAERFDIVILSDPLNRHFREGVPGCGTSFRTLVDAVGRHFPRENYRRHVAIGTSMGGLPAVWYGLMAGADRTIGIGARAAWDVTRLLDGQGPRHAYDPVCACCSGRHREIVFVHARDHETDRIQAGHFARILNAQVLAIPGVDNHSPLAQLWESGSLSPFLVNLIEARAFRPRWVVQKRAQA